MRRCASCPHDAPVEELLRLSLQQLGRQGGLTMREEGLLTGTEPCPRTSLRRRAAAPTDGGVHRPGRAQGPALHPDRGGPRPAASPSTTCCSPARPGSGRRRWPAFSPTRWAPSFRATSGPALERPGDLAAVSPTSTRGDVLFIDEVHRLPRQVEEVLYPAMEDFQLDIIVGKGPAARSIRLDLPHFTLVGATTRVGRVAPPLRDRFGYVARLDYYEPADLPQIVTGRPGSSTSPSPPMGRTRLPSAAGVRPASPTGCCAGCATTPRCAPTGPSTSKTADRRACECSRSTTPGSTRSTASSSSAIIEKFGGGPVGLSTLAIAVGEEPETVEDAYEPFLLQQGFLQRTPRGRIATPAPTTTSGLPPLSQPPDPQQSCWTRAPSAAAPPHSTAAGSAHPPADPIHPDGGGHCRVDCAAAARECLSYPADRGNLELQLRTTRPTPLPRRPSSRGMPRGF